MFKYNFLLSLCFFLFIWWVTTKFGQKQNLFLALFQWKRIFDIRFNFYSLSMHKHCEEFLKLSHFVSFLSQPFFHMASSSLASFSFLKLISILNFNTYRSLILSIPLSQHIFWTVFSWHPEKGIKESLAGRLRRSRSLNFTVCTSRLSRSLSFGSVTSSC